MDFNLIIDILNNNIPDTVGWVGNIAFVTGAILLARKNIKGWYFNFIGNSAYVVQGILLSMPSLAILSIFLMYINVIGIKHWKKEQKPDNRIILPATDIAILYQIGEFLKHVKYFANESHVDSFDEYDKMCDKYLNMKKETEDALRKRK